MISIKSTDKVFQDSPDAGDPVCLCSRCLQVIAENDCPLRCWPEKGEVGHDPKAKGGTEYRFCHSCCEKMGIHYAINEPDHEGPLDDPQAWEGGFAENH